MENIGKFVVFLVGVIISSIITGFVFSKLWLWFIVPIFSVDPLRVVEAIGIMVLIGYVRTRFDSKAKEDDFWEKFTSLIIFSVFLGGFTLFWGWVITLFL